MSGQTEIKPVRNACRHLRARYKLERRGKSPFPERELLRYECDRGMHLDSAEGVDQCMANAIECWQEKSE